ncbi:UNKNOWN [Stylonychia lemnae]|uniref:EF-hand domain-containing protein n=1 Tax=Stylonychia lemnae TaxID=5949 RepID=A0A078ANF7_STYLE|nr:UNKNOWN [Stylonychia lemnae]|eukprot:CDW83446.1 UNKNOWN [Stylonychia lemnae]
MNNNTSPNKDLQKNLQRLNELEQQLKLKQFEIRGQVKVFEEQKLDKDQERKQMLVNKSIDIEQDLQVLPQQYNIQDSIDSKDNKRCNMINMNVNNNLILLPPSNQRQEFNFTSRINSGVSIKSDQFKNYFLNQMKLHKHLQQTGDEDPVSLDESLISLKQERPIDKQISVIDPQIQQQSFAPNPNNVILLLDLKDVNNILTEENLKVYESLIPDQSSKKKKDDDEGSLKDSVNISLQIKEQEESLQQKKKVLNKSKEQVKEQDKSKQSTSQVNQSKVQIEDPFSFKNLAAKSSEALKKQVVTRVLEKSMTKKRKQTENRPFSAVVKDLGYIINFLSEIFLNDYKSGTKSFIDESEQRNQKNFLQIANRIAKFEELYDIAFDKFQEKPLLIMFIQSFKVEEVHQMFMKFYQQFDVDESLTFEIEEISELLELYAEKMGKEKMKAILQNTGVKFDSGIKAIFKEGGYSNQAFTPEIYDQFFEILASDGEDFVHFNNLLPYLMIFFLSSQFQAIKDRKKMFEQVLGEGQYKTGIYRSFMKYGLQHNELDKPLITYRLVEKVVVEMRTIYQSSFGFDQIELILRQVRIKMEVDPISKIERAKMCYRDKFSGQSFSRWLALLISLQMTWTRLKKKLKGEKDPFIYLYEEKLWFIAANVDTFCQDSLNRLVKDKYMEKMLDYKEERSFRRENESSFLQTEIDESCQTINTEQLFKQINLKVRQNV